MLESVVPIELIGFLSHLKPPETKHNEEGCAHLVQQQVGGDHLVDGLDRDFTEDVDELPVVSVIGESLVQQNEVGVKGFVSDLLSVDEQEEDAEQRQTKDPKHHEGKSKGKSPDQMFGFPAFHSEVSG